jgi:hypothetical protein
MKLVLRRSAQGMLGKIIFLLSVRAAISVDEHKAIRKYKLGDMIPYAKKPIVDPGSSLLGVAYRLAQRAMTIW